MTDELDDFLVTKTTTEVYAVSAKDIPDAETAVAKGEAVLIQRNSQINSRPKPLQPQTGQPPVTQPGQSTGATLTDLQKAQAQSKPDHRKS